MKNVSTKVGANLEIFLFAVPPLLYLYAAMKTLKGFTFNTKRRLCLMGNLSSHSALRTKFLIMYFCFL